MSKKIYIMPLTEVIRVNGEGSLLQETLVDTGDGSGSQHIVPVSQLDDDEEIAAKPFNVWDDDNRTYKNIWGD